MVDIGNLTNEQTKKLARDALAQLSNDDVIEVLTEGIHSHDLKEILEQLTDKLLNMKS
jgi:uncharacterized protein (DUF2267 family)